MKRLVLFFTVIFFVTGFFTYASENNFKEILKKKVYQKRNNREKREKIKKEMKHRKEMIKQREESEKKAKFIQELRKSGKTSYTFPEYRTKSRADGTISGTVTDADTGNPLPNENIFIYDESYNWIDWISSSNTGYYSISIAPGNYKLECYKLNSKYRLEWYDNKPDFSSADIVTVPDGGSVTVDFQLDEGGYLNVTCLDEDTALPIENIWVYASGISNVYDYSDTSGVAHLQGLCSGDYKIYAGGNGYLYEYYQDKDWDNADLVSVTEKNTTSITMYLKLGGIITGVVKDSVLNTPISNIRIEIENKQGDYSYWCWTFADGTYSMDGLPTGQYYVKAFDDNNYYYGMEWYDNKESPNTADLVSVTLGNTTPNIDFSLSEGGYITGKVVSTDSGLPIEWADIEIYSNAQDWDSYITDSYTDSNGDYRISGLPNGNFYVNCYVWDENYISEWYDNQYHAINANPVSVTSGNTTTNINFSLETGGIIEGNVYYQNASNPEKDIWVNVLDKDTGEFISSGDDWYWAATNPGYYIIKGLCPGNYKLFVIPDDNTRAFEWYEDKNSFTDATLVSATAGDITSNIDFILDDCGYISGKVLNGATPVENAKIRSYRNIGPYYGWVVWWLSNDTDASGNYFTPGLNTGQYKVQCECGLGELWYDNKSDSSTATLVSVTKPNTTSNINFNYAGAIPKWSISGTITDGTNPIPDVTVDLTGDSAASTVTDEIGNYVFNNLPEGGTYILTPTKTHYNIFAPVNRIYTDLSNDIANADFTGTLDKWTISGTITDTGSNPISGVTVDLTGDLTASTITAGSGNYAFSNLDAGSTYIVTPQKAGVYFVPASKTFTDLDGDKIENLVGTLNAYSIDGTITIGGNPLPDVTVSISGDSTGSTITDGSGNYVFNNLGEGGTYIVTPNSIKYSFAPPYRTYPDLSSDITGDTFAATLLYYDISGNIKDSNGNPMTDVLVSLSGYSSGNTATNSSGNYSFTHLEAGEDYTITPTKKNYTFIPENVPFVNLNSNKVQDFIGTKNFTEALDQVIVYPNPWKIDIGTDVVTFANLTEKAKIQIYTISGNLIFEAEADNIEYQWNIKNKDDNDIASGVYIYTITNNKGDKKIGKFVVIR